VTIGGVGSRYFLAWKRRVTNILTWPLEISISSGNGRHNADAACSPVPVSGALA
jgi:hypothetical protein